jgi:hypothetical protein
MCDTTCQMAYNIQHGRRQVVAFDFDQTLTTPAAHKQLTLRGGEPRLRLRERQSHCSMRMHAQVLTCCVVLDALMQARTRARCWRGFMHSTCRW